MRKRMDTNWMRWESLHCNSRIDVMQREDHAVSVAEVKEIMDEAISHSQKANVKHLARRVFGKGTDDSDRIILKEEDFRI